MHTPHDLSLDDLLIAFLAGEPDARRELPIRLNPDLERLASSMSPVDLRRRGLVDDVVGRTWELLLRRRKDSFEPERGTAMAYIATLVRTAIRDVRVENAVIVRRSRDYSLDASGSVIVVEDGVADAGLLEVEFLDVLDRALGDDPGVRSAAVLVALEGRPLSVAAEAVDTSRFVLKRRLAAALTVEMLAA